MDQIFSRDKTRSHYQSLHYTKLPDFIRQLRTRQARAVSASALEFCILTASRAGEVLGAVWPEIDWENRVWVIPAARMKSRVEHRVPLSDRAMEILKRQLQYSGAAYSAPSAANAAPQFVFQGYNRDRMDEKSLRTLLRNMDVRVTVHGFRATFKSWATEQTQYPWEVIELCLAHKVGTAVAQSYLRGDALEKRREVMEAWATFCG
jgi:integrase